MRETPQAPAAGVEPANGHRAAFRPESLRERLAAAGRALGEREAPHRAALEEATTRCHVLHARVRAALEDFHAAAAAAGAPHLSLVVSEPRLDEKHVRASEFEIRRGRHTGIVIAKAKREFTFVGPFRTGKAEGPCRSVPFDAPAEELDAALAEFLERLVEEAATP
jgi:hypothetical protein